jgi:hypothetical protein
MLNLEKRHIILCLTCKVKSVIIYTMEKIKELILNVNRILWNKKLENKVQDYLDNLLKQMQDYH